MKEQSEYCEMIKLSFIDGKVMTFNGHDYMTIRRKFRIVGKLIGIPIAYPRNMNWNGLPAIYNEYEAKLLLEKNFVIIEDRRKLRNPPAEEHKEIFQNHQENLEHKIRKDYIESRLDETRANMDKIIEGKKKKLKKSGIPENEIDVTSEDIIKQRIESLEESFPSSIVPTQILNEYPFSSQLEFTQIKDLEVTNIGKYQIFRDLWEKNFILTNGDSFGCDFLCYPGDPVSFHASQLIHVIEPSEKFNVKYLVSCGRLSVSVNKKCVFAFIRDNNEVIYQTLEWDNPKLREQFKQQPSTSTSNFNDK